jgi:ureidoacrylate peracid hydrolase
MEPEQESLATCNYSDNNSTTSATSSAFLNLDIVNGDIVNIHNAHVSPVAAYSIGFPDMLPPSREASTTSEPNGSHQVFTTTTTTTTKLEDALLLDQTTAKIFERKDAIISKQPPNEEDTKGEQAASTSAILQGETTRIITACSLRELVQMGVSKRTDFPLRNSRTALLIIDVQTFCCDGVDVAYYQETSRPRMLSNIQSLLQSFRKHRDAATTKTTISCGCEVIFTMIQSQTKDGRDSSLDYKLSGPYFSDLPKVDATFQELFLPSIMPSTTVGRGDIVIPKTACSVFTSTNLDYVLRNLHMEQLVVCGQLTEQCVESAVRDAADLGYFVTLVEDACATYSLERHEQGLSGMKGFCRIVSTQQVLEELVSQETPSDPPKSSYSFAVVASVVPTTDSEATRSASQPAPTTTTTK